ncbi:MAG: glycosyltransferase [Sphingobium sp.]
MPDAQERAIPLCVCVPARNEADRLPILLDALARQDWPSTIPVSIAINNTTDESIAVVEAAGNLHADRLAIHVTEAHFPPDLAHAGSARRLAMDEGIALLAGAQEAILVSTDADARPPADWLSNIAAAFARGADLVGGSIEIDEEDGALPPAVRGLRAAWDRYWAKVRTIEDEVDPLSWDPAPRHGDHTGASLAIGADVYRACGGVPVIPTGEDRALVRAALTIGARLAHPANVRIRVSSRTDGRAEGGMATAMQQLFSAAEQGRVPMAPAFDHWQARAAWRKAMRGWPDGHVQIARQESSLPPMPHDMPLDMGE